MPSERSRHLHNFSLPPDFKWGNQRLLRFTKPPTLTESHNLRTHSQILHRQSPARHCNGNKLAEEKDSASSAADVTAVRPWNLKTRRAACEEPPVQSNANARVRGGRLRLFGVEKKEKVKFSVSLLKKEVEDDFLAMFGTMPLRRTRKRTKAVQKQLDSMFPDLWLPEVTLESGKVPDIPEP